MPSSLSIEILAMDLAKDPIIALVETLLELDLSESAAEEASAK